jgi:hypothetical protein
VLCILTLLKHLLPTFKGGLTILKELKIAHHENSVPKKIFFPYFSIADLALNSNIRVEKWEKKSFFGTEFSW